MKEIRATPRSWQLIARQKEIIYRNDGGKRPLLAASPGAGKTLYAVMDACEFCNQENGKLIIVVAPTKNIKRGWIKEFRAHGFKATGDIQNSVLREHLENREDIKSDYEVIVITYQQLAQSDGLFSFYAERYRTFVIADEVHHADDRAEFGTALTKLAENAARRLALSGTPFTTSGGALAMCDCQEALDEETGKRVQQTEPFYEYSYGDALSEKEVCRIIEFGVVYGKATVTYENLTTGTTFDRIIEGKRKTDSLRPFLDLEGEFLPTMLEQGLAELGSIKQYHRRAAMLIVAQDGKAAGDIEVWLRDNCSYSIQVIVHDTDKAHDRIERLPKDNTDIVIAVRMITEGIDVKRFRVGVFASDVTTQLFFIQFVGRFIRWDQDAPEPQNQYAVMILPGHVALVEYARIIEKMIIDSAIKMDNGNGGDDPPEPTPYIKVGTKSEATEQKTITRGTELNAADEDLVQEWERKNPNMEGWYSKKTILDILKGHRGDRREEADMTDGQKTWRDKNNSTASSVVTALRRTGLRDDDLYAKVNEKANVAVGIRKMDALTPENKLKERHSYLRNWLGRIFEDTSNGRGRGFE